MGYKIEIIGNVRKMWTFRSDERLPCGECTLREGGCLGQPENKGDIQIALDAIQVRVGYKRDLGRSECGVLGEIKKFKKK